MDKEFQQISKDSRQGRRFADKLVRVWRKQGTAVWVLVHIEVQGFYEKDFAKRMFVYNYRIFDRYDEPVVSLALLTDSNSRWRPDSFEYELWGSRTALHFPIFKLIDCLADQENLANSNNPFAICAVAQLQAHETVKTPEDRQKLKFILSRKLYEHGFLRQEIINLCNSSPKGKEVAATPNP